MSFWQRIWGAYCLAGAASLYIPGMSFRDLMVTALVFAGVMILTHKPKDPSHD